MGIHSALNNVCAKIIRSPMCSPIAIQYYCAMCGAAAGIMFILAFIIAGFIPPPAPSWDAQTIAQCGTQTFD